MLRISGHPADDEPADGDVGTFNRPAPGAPGLWCPWTACERGHCLHWDGVEKPYVLGGPDAVLVSEKSLGALDRVALAHERDAGRISDGEYRRRVEELRQPAPLTPAR